MIDMDYPGTVNGSALQMSGDVSNAVVLEEMTVPVWVETLEDLHRYYGTPAEASQLKVTTRLTSGYRAHIERASGCCSSFYLCTPTDLPGYSLGS